MLAIDHARPAALRLATVAVAGAALLAGSGSAGAAGCPVSNSPNTLRVVGGSPQTTQLEKPFPANLQVALANTNGCPLTIPLGGISVTFTAPSGGASGTFAGSGSNSVTVGTDGNGMATAPQLTANDTPGAYSVHVSSPYGSVDLSLANTANGVVASIAATGWATQEASLNAQYGQPLQAQVLDANGHPVQGANVTFSLGAGAYGASASFLGGGQQATVATNASGQATSPPFVANGSPGRFTATASVSGISSVAMYNLANHAWAATITATSASVQRATVNDRYAPLEARVLDAAGQPLEGVTVTFSLAQTANGPGASFLGGASQVTATTNVDGRATSPALLANGAAGRFTATAAIAGSAEPARYWLRNLAGAPSSIAAGSASGESTRAGSRFPIRLAVTVTDADGNPVPGAVVTFVAPAQGAGGRFNAPTPGAPHGVRKRRIVRVKTDGKGVAVAPTLTANRTPGGFAVTASVDGAARPATFALVNTA